MEQNRVGKTLFVNPDHPVELEPQTWCKLYDVEILDPDGWRGADHKRFTELITLEEFTERVNRSTAKGQENLPQVRGKNTPLNEAVRPFPTPARSNTMDESTQQPAAATQIKVKVPFRQRVRNFMTKHPRLPKAVALIGAALGGAAAYKVASERRVVHEETLAQLEADAGYSLDSAETRSPVTEV